MLQKKEIHGRNNFWLMPWIFIFYHKTYPSVKPPATAIDLVVILIMHLLTYVLEGRHKDSPRPSMRAPFLLLGQKIHRQSQSHGLCLCPRDATAPIQCRNCSCQVATPCWIKYFKSQVFIFPFLSFLFPYFGWVFFSIIAFRNFWSPSSLTDFSIKSLKQRDSSIAVQQLGVWTSRVPAIISTYSSLATYSFMVLWCQNLKKKVNIPVRTLRWGTEGIL